MTRNRKITYFVIILLLVGSLSLFFYKKSDARLGSGGISIPQAAPICTNGQYLTVNGKPFLLPFAAKRYSYGIIVPYVKVWSLSLYSPGGVCVQPFPLPTLPVTGTIIMIGTSLPTGL